MSDKYSTWRCARCRGVFPVDEPMHGCYRGSSHPPRVNDYARALLEDAMKAQDELGKRIVEICDRYGLRK